MSEQVAAASVDLITIIDERLKAIIASGTFRCPESDERSLRDLRIIEVTLDDRLKAYVTLMLDLKEEHRAMHNEEEAARERILADKFPDIESALADDDTAIISALVESMKPYAEKCVDFGKLEKLVKAVFSENLKRSFPELRDVDRVAVANDFKVYAEDDRAHRDRVIFEEFEKVFGDMPGFAGAMFVGANGRVRRSMRSGGQGDIGELLTTLFRRR